MIFNEKWAKKINRELKQGNNLKFIIIWK